MMMPCAMRRARRETNGRQPCCYALAHRDFVDSCPQNLSEIVVRSRCRRTPVDRRTALGGLRS